MIFSGKVFHFLAIVLKKQMLATECPWWLYSNYYGAVLISTGPNQNFSKVALFKIGYT